MAAPFKLDDNLLHELGLGTLPVDEKNRMLQHIYETLEMRVGMRLAEQMSDQQLDEFEGFIERKDEAGALRWLETNFPNYKDVVAQELDKLKGEIKAVAPQIVAQSQATRQAVPPQPSSYQPAPGQPMPSPYTQYTQEQYQAPQPTQYQQPMQTPPLSPVSTQMPGQFQQPNPFAPQPSYQSAMPPTPGAAPSPMSTTPQAQPQYGAPQPMPPFPPQNPAAPSSDQQSS